MTITMPTIDDVTGQKFGRLTAVRFIGLNRDNRPIWRFKCDCGNYKDIALRWVKSGHSQSCSCLMRERVTKRNFKHGATKHNNIATPEWRSWLSMRTRISKKSYHAYEHYKKRGITICERWLNPQSGFKNFLADMGKRPDGMTLDRIDNNKGYYPENCRWATHKQQMNNTRSNRIITFDGVSLNQTQWAEKLGLPNSNIILKRLKRGWSVEETLTTPLKVFRNGKWW